MISLVILLSDSFSSYWTYPHGFSSAKNDKRRKGRCGASEIPLGMSPDVLDCQNFFKQEK